MLQLALALLVATAPSPTPRAVDPTGKYDWSFSMQGGGSQTITGSMEITKADSGYSVSMSSNTQPGVYTSKNVTFEKDTLTAYVNGEFGTFGIQIAYKADGSIEGRWSLQTQQGSTNGPLAIERVKKPDAKPDGKP